MAAVQLETLNPAVLRLAELVSFAAIVDRALLRAARLEMLPDVDAGAEADLWFSGIVQSRTTQGIVFDPSVKAQLQRRLTPESAQRAWMITRREHEWLSPALLLEEEVAFLSLSDDPEALEQVAERLRSVIVAMIHEGRESLALWGARALPMLPASVRDLEEAKMLDFGVRIRLGMQPPGSEDEPLPNWISWIAPSALQARPVWLELSETALKIDARPGRGTSVMVPATDPILLEISWEQDDQEKVKRVMLRPDESVSLSVGAGPIRMRTVRGAEYVIRHGVGAISAYAGRVVDFRWLIDRHHDLDLSQPEFQELSNAISAAEGAGGRRISVVGSRATDLLAGLVRQLEPRTPTFVHFFDRSDSRAGSIRVAEESLVAQIALRYGLPERAGDFSLDEALSELERLPVTPRIVLLLDAVDAVLDSDDDAVDQLLPSIPSFVTVVASSRRARHADVTVELPGAHSTVGEQPAQRIIRVGVLSAISKLDLREAIDSISGMVLGQIYEAPYAIVAGAGEPQVQPLLFEPLLPEGRLRFSAAIRSGIKFSDGTPLTAELAARSLRDAKALMNKAKVDVDGERVVFTLIEPNPRFDFTLTQAITSIVLDRSTQLLGTGAFMFEQRPNLRMLQSTKSFRLVRNPHHARSGVDEIEFRVYPAAEDGTPRALIDALRNGEVDLTTSLTMADVSANQIPGLALSLQPGNSTGILFFNCQRPTLTSTAVRRGIALSLDLHELATRSFDKNPAAFLAPNLLPPLMGRASGLPVLDRREANRLLDASGVKPRRLSLLVPWAPRPYMPKPMPLAQAVQRQLAEVGISIDLREPKTSDEFFDDLLRGNYDLALAGWIADTPDPADFFETLLSSKMCEGNNHSNLSRWKSPVMDVALARFREQPTEDHKREIHRIVRDEAPLVPLIYGQSVVVHSRKVRNVSMSATGVVTLSGMTVS